VFPLVACNLRHFLIGNAAQKCKNNGGETVNLLQKDQVIGKKIEIFLLKP